MNLNIPSPLEKLHINDKIGSIYIKRDDLIHPMISGNKWRKLKYLVKDFQGDTLVTYGGAYSNHILAVAAYAKLNNLKSLSYIRGEELHATNPTLKICQKLGMEFSFIDRDTYRKKTIELKQNATKTKDNSLIIPEGGSTIFVKNGMKELLDEIRDQIEYKEPLRMYCSYGTGGTAYGILHNMTADESLTVVPAIKGVSEEKFLENSMDVECDIITPYNLTYYETMKRYAAKDLNLFNFCEEFLKKHNILLDPIYTSKVMYYLLNHEENEECTKVFLHSGGNQAWNGYFFRFPELKDELPEIYNYLKDNAFSIA